MELPLLASPELDLVTDRVSVLGPTPIDHNIADSSSAGGNFIELARAR